MGIISYFKGQLTDQPGSDRATELRQYIVEVEARVHFDWTQRVFGDGTYSGYQTLRDFYKGKQWSFRKEGGGTMRTYNYVFTVVENMTAFLTNEPPQISSPARDVTNMVERSMAEGRTKILTAIHEENALGLVFQRAARTASITGDAFIFGSIPTFKVTDDGTRVFENIRYWNIERPENIRIVWKDENYSEIAGFIKQYRISTAVAKKLFKHEIASAGLVIAEDFDVQNNIGVPKTNIPMMTVKEYWDDSEYMLLFNHDNKIVDYVKHDWGFMPLQYVPNIHLPGEAKGTSDIEHELDPQQEYNERASDLADIIKEMSRPSYWGKNLDNLTEVRSGQISIYQVGDDGDIQAMPKSGQTVPVESYLNDRKNDMIALSGLNQVLYPGTHVMQATGRALSVIMQGVNNKVSLRKEWWVRAFKQLNKTILFHAQNHIPDANKVIDGYFKTDVFVSSVLLRSVTDEISKFQARVQSLTTTQSNIGIANPSEEQKLMKEELQDPILATEIAKQPGLLEQILQKQNQPQQPAPAAGGGGTQVQNPDNTPGANPPPVPGVPSPVSPAAAIAGNAARHGGIPVAPKK